MNKKNFDCWWEKATDTERKLFFAISEIFDKDEKLLEFTFENKSPRLREQAHKLIEEIKTHYPAKDLLLRIALDIWCSCGDVYLWELFEFLNQKEFKNVVKAICMLGPKFKWGCDYVRSGYYR